MLQLPGRVPLALLLPGVLLIMNKPRSIPGEFPSPGSIPGERPSPSSCPARELGPGSIPAQG